MYKLHHNHQNGDVVSIEFVADGKIIPLDENNSDYQSFLEWNAKQEKPLSLKDKGTILGESEEEIRSKKKKNAIKSIMTELAGKKFRPSTDYEKLIVAIATSLELLNEKGDVVS